MSLIATTLLILSSITHASWNTFSKSKHPTLAFYFVANTFGVFCILPILPLYWIQIVLIPITVWIFISLSGLFLAAYMTALAGAYQNGDMSIAYPIARAVPIIFVTVVSWALELGTVVSAWFVIGAVLILIGCIMLPIRTDQNIMLSRYFNFCGLLSVVAAGFIASYTIIDHQALIQLRNLPGTPFTVVDATLIYLVLEGISTSIWQGIFVLFIKKERERTREILNEFKSSAALTGIGIYLTYGLVLTSMNYVTNVSYVAAFRQLSIPLGAIFGFIVLKESQYPLKILGLMLICLGLGLIAMM